MANLDFQEMMKRVFNAEHMDQRWRFARREQEEWMRQFWARLHIGPNEPANDIEACDG